MGIPEWLMISKYKPNIPIERLRDSDKYQYPQMFRNGWEINKSVPTHITWFNVIQF